MQPATGIVSTQAQTMLTVIPQRTALSRRVLPNPTMEPAMVWVVLTGMPAAVGGEERHGGPRFGAESAEGIELGDFRAHGFHDPPAAQQGAQAHGGMTDQHIQNAISNVCPFQMLV